MLSARGGNCSEKVVRHARGQKRPERARPSDKQGALRPGGVATFLSLKWKTLGKSFSKQVQQTRQNARKSHTLRHPQRYTRKDRHSRTNGLQRCTGGGVRLRAP